MSQHNSIITRCPHCSTAFRATVEVLSVAQGNVRCGSCLTVFNAAEHDTNSSKASTLFSNASEKTVSKQVAQEPQQENSSDESWALELMATEEREAPRSHKKKPTTLGNIESPEEIRKKKDASPNTLRKNTSSNHSNNEDTDSLFSDLIINDLKNSKADSRLSQNFSENTSAQKKQSKIYPQKPDNWDNSGDKSDNESDDKSDDKSNRIFNEQLDEALLADDDSFFDIHPLNIDDTPNRGWPWLLGSVAMIIIIVAQWAWIRFDSFSTQPTYRPYYASVCNIIGCQLPLLSDAQKIRTTNLVIRSHPDEKNALIADIILHNYADFEQQFPALKLSFLNINGETIASRAFQPSEYLKGELTDQVIMPKQQAVQLSLALIDPGKSAVNYRIYVMPANKNR